MKTEFLGQGWRFPVQRTAEGGVAMTDDETGIPQSIWLILATAPGERLMRPDFGCGIHDLVFASNDASTASRLVAAVRRALALWEPRIDLLAVTVTPDTAEGNRLLIHIDYQVRATNSRYNLVYPFYLE